MYKILRININQWKPKYCKYLFAPLYDQMPDQNVSANPICTSNDIIGTVPKAMLAICAQLLFDCWRRFYCKGLRGMVAHKIVSPFVCLISLHGLK